MRSSRTGQLQKETAKDKTLSMLMEDIHRGVSRNSLTRYSQVFDELTVMEGMVVRGDQLVIP